MSPLSPLFVVPDVDPGRAAALDWLPLASLVVEPAYQRPLMPRNLTAIKKICQNFNWSRFGALIVAPLDDGTFAIIDGQHRAHAALAAGLDAVPCVICDLDPTERARTFAAINGEIQRLSSANVFRAALAASEPWAVAARAAVAAAGCELMDRAVTEECRQVGQVSAIRLVAGFVGRGEGSVVTAGLDALRRSEWGAADPGAYAGGVLNPWFRALATNQRFQRVDLADFLDEHDIETIVIRARDSARQSLGRSGVALAAEMIAILLRRALESRAA